MAGLGSVIRTETCKFRGVKPGVSSVGEGVKIHSVFEFCDATTHRYVKGGSIAEDKRRLEKRGLQMLNNDLGLFLLRSAQQNEKLIATYVPD